MIHVLTQTVNTVKEWLFREKSTVFYSISGVLLLYYFYNRTYPFHAEDIFLSDISKPNIIWKNTFLLEKT